LLRLVGTGRHHAEVVRLVGEFPAQTTWTPRLETPDVVRAFDDSWGLLLVSRSEGTPRVGLEALCRGRAVIGARAGGIPDVVRHDETGLLVDPEDHNAIADALVRVLSDRGLAERYGEAGRRWSSDWVYTPEEYAAKMVDLVERALGAGSGG
jgi:glycosyltransferase involved in cell wall biosynthesis